MPERPLIRVSFLHFYEMVSGPAYHESEVAVLGMDGAEAGWVVLTLPVTSGAACIAGRASLGLPKVMRRITRERSPTRQVGTLYGLGGAEPEMVLAVDLGGDDEATRALVRQYGSLSPFGLLHGKVIKFAPSGITADELMARGDYDIRLGQARLEFAPGSLVQRLGVGAPLAAHWTRVRVRYAITVR